MAETHLDMVIFVESLDAIVNSILACSSLCKFWSSNVMLLISLAVVQLKVQGALGTAVVGRLMVGALDPCRTILNSRDRKQQSGKDLS